MKNVTALLLLSLTFESALANNSCGVRRAATAASSAASAMVSGYTAHRFIKASDVERAAVQARILLATPKWRNQLNQFQQGDDLFVIYARNPEITRLQGIVESQKKRIEKLSQESVELSKEYYSLKRTLGQNAWESPEIARMENRIKKLADVQLSGLQRMNRTLAQLNQLKEATPVNPVRLRLRQTSIAALDASMEGLEKSGAYVHSIEVLPRSTVRSLSRIRTGGWVLAASALTAGVLTVDQLASGKIACYREHEMRSMRL